MAETDFVELRGDVPRADADVMDAIVHATPGASRMSLLRDIVAAWAKQERMKAMMVMRVCGGNGTGPELDRNRSGTKAR